MIKSITIDGVEYLDIPDIISETDIPLSALACTNSPYPTTFGTTLWLQDKNGNHLTRSAAAKLLDDTYPVVKSNHDNKTRNSRHKPAKTIRKQPTDDNA